MPLTLQHFIILYIRITANNTFITCTRPYNIITLSSSTGALGHKGRQTRNKVVVLTLLRIFQTYLKRHFKMYCSYRVGINLVFRGPYSWRYAILKTFKKRRIFVRYWLERIHVPHNGVRLKKRRRK
jgi:ribosomal protein S11